MDLSTSSKASVANILWQHVAKLTTNQTAPKKTYHDMNFKIRLCQTGHEWHPDDVLTWMKCIIEVVLLIIIEYNGSSIDGIFHLIFHDFILTMDRYVNKSWSLSFKGETNQVTLTNVAIADETPPIFSSHLGLCVSFMYLECVGASISFELYSVARNIIEHQPHIAWDYLCIKKQIKFH